MKKSDIGIWKSLIDIINKHDDLLSSYLIKATPIGIKDHVFLAEINDTDIWQNIIWKNDYITSVITEIENDVTRFAIWNSVDKSWTYIAENRAIWYYSDIIKAWAKGYTLSEIINPKIIDVNGKIDVLPWEDIFINSVENMINLLLWAYDNGRGKSITLMHLPLCYALLGNFSSWLKAFDYAEIYKNEYSYDYGFELIFDYIKNSITKWNENKDITIQTVDNAKSLYTIETEDLIVARLVEGYNKGYISCAYLLFLLKTEASQKLSGDAIKWLRVYVDDVLEKKTSIPNFFSIELVYDLAHYYYQGYGILKEEPETAYKYFIIGRALSNPKISFNKYDKEYDKLMEILRDKTERIVKEAEKIYNRYISNDTESLEVNDKSISEWDIKDIAKVKIYISVQDEAIDFSSADITEMRIDYSDDCNTYRTMVSLKDFKDINAQERRGLIKLAYCDTMFNGLDRVEKIERTSLSLDHDKSQQGVVASRLNNMFRNIFGDRLESRSSFIKRGKGSLKLKLILTNPEKILYPNL